MKKILLLGAIFVCLCASGCRLSDLSAIGGADGPSGIIINDSNIPAAIDKEPLRLIRIDGSLYYDTDLDFHSDGTVTEGQLTKSASNFELPKGDGECNFSGSSGYRHSSESNTIYVLIGDEWETFRRIDAAVNPDTYRYCLKAETKVPLTDKETEYLLLANDLNISASDIEKALAKDSSGNSKNIFIISAENS